MSGGEHRSPPLVSLRAIGVVDGAIEFSIPFSFIGDPLLCFTQLLLRFALELLCFSFDLLARVIGQIAECATHFPFEFLAGAFDTIGQAVVLVVVRHD